MTPFRMTPVGRLLRTTRHTTRRDVTVFLIVTFLLACLLACIAVGIVRHVAPLL
jgi:hypothetical protein